MFYFNVSGFLLRCFTYKYAQSVTIYLPEWTQCLAGMLSWENSDTIARLERCPTLRLYDYTEQIGCSFRSSNKHWSVCDVLLAKTTRYTNLKVRVNITFYVNSNKSYRETIASLTMG